MSKTAFQQASYILSYPYPFLFRIFFVAEMETFPFIKTYRPCQWERLRVSTFFSFGMWKIHCFSSLIFKTDNTFKLL